MKDFGIYNKKNEAVDVVKARTQSEAMRKFIAKQKALGLSTDTEGYWAEELNS